MQNLTYYFSLAGIAALGAGTAYTFYSSQPCKSVLGQYSGKPQDCTGSRQLRIFHAASGIHLAKLPAHQLPHELPDFQLTDHKGKIFTHNNLKNEFAVLLFGTIDNPDTRMWLERLGKMICESGKHTAISSMLSILGDVLYHAAHSSIRLHACSCGRIECSQRLHVCLLCSSNPLTHSRAIAGYSLCMELLGSTSLSPSFC